VVKQAKAQAFQLAHDLGTFNKAPLLRTLDCIGFFQDYSRKRFGLMFELPTSSNFCNDPLSLSSYIQDVKVEGKSIPLPTLSERIRLARGLAYSVLELHLAGTLHKNLHSGNVVFFPDRFTNAISVSMMFIVGFEVSRPDQENQLSVALDGKEFDIYKHPHLLHPSNEVQGRPGSERKYDVYSLGLILLEIGLWKSLKSLYKPKLSALENARQLAGIARFNLPHQMGRKYCEMVLDCIDCENLRFSGLYGKDLGRVAEASKKNNDERGGVSLQVFIAKVIRILEMCHCQED
jgi:hypothetical protein